MKPLPAIPISDQTFWLWVQRHLANFEVVSAIPTVDDLKNGDVVIYESGTTRRLYVNINGTIRFLGINNANKIIDLDGDTSIELERTADGDIVWIKTAGSDRIKIDASGNMFIGDGGVTNYTKIAPDGEITLFGTARVIDVIDVEPDAVRRPVANPPGESLEDGFPCHDYDDTTDESVFKHVELTHRYAAAGLIHVHLDYFVDVGPVDGTVDNLSWGLEYKKISIGDVFTFASGTTLVYAADVVTQGNNKKTHQSDALSLTTTGFVAGDIVLMRIFRDASGTGNTDNVSGDVRVFDYHIEFLVDKLGEAT